MVKEHDFIIIIELKLKIYYYLNIYKKWMVCITFINNIIPTYFVILKIIQL